MVPAMLKRVVAALVLLSALLLAGCGQIQLFGNLSESSANEIMAVLQEQGIDCSKVAGAENTYAVMVDELELQRSMRLLERLNLPRPVYESMGTVFAKSGIVSTPTEEKARMVYALTQELTETFSRITGVLEARVHIVMRDVSDLGAEISPASAAIFLKVNGDNDGPGLSTQKSVEDITNIAVNAVPDLSPGRVKVVVFPVETPIARGDSSALKARRERQTTMYMLVGGVVAALALLGGGGYFLMSRKKGAKKKTPPPPSSLEAEAAPAPEPAEGS